MSRNGSRHSRRRWRSSREIDRVQMSDRVGDATQYLSSLDIDTDFSVRGLERSDNLVRLLRESYAKNVATIVKEAH